MRKNDLTDQLIARADRTIRDVRANRESLDRFLATLGSSFHAAVSRDLDRAERQAEAIIRRARLYAINGGRR